MEKKEYGYNRRTKSLLSISPPPQQLPPKKRSSYPIHLTPSRGVSKNGFHTNSEVYCSLYHEHEREREGESVRECVYGKWVSVLLIPRMIPRDVENNKTKCKSRHALSMPIRCSRTLIIRDKPTSNLPCLKNLFPTRAYQSVTSIVPLPLRPLSFSWSSPLGQVPLLPVLRSASRLLGFFLFLEVDFPNLSLGTTMSFDTTKSGRSMTLQILASLTQLLKFAFCSFTASS